MHVNTTQATQILGLFQILVWFPGIALFLEEQFSQIFFFFLHDYEFLLLKIQASCPSVRPSFITTDPVWGCWVGAVAYPSWHATGRAHFGQVASHIWRGKVFTVCEFNVLLCYMWYIQIRLYTCFCSTKTRLCCQVVKHTWRRSRFTQQPTNAVWKTHDRLLYMLHKDCRKVLIDGQNAGT